MIADGGGVGQRGIDPGGLDPDEVDGRQIERGETEELRRARIAVAGEAVAEVVREGRAVIAVVDHILRRDRADRVVDLDVVVIRRDRQPRNEARLQHHTDGVGVGGFLAQIGIARDSACKAGAERIGEAGRDAVGAAVVDAVLDVGITGSHQRVDLGLVAGIERAEEGSLRRREEFRDVRRPHRARVGAAHADVLDRRPEAVDRVGEHPADRAVVRIAARKFEAQFVEERHILDKRGAEFAEQFDHVVLAARILEEPVGRGGKRGLREALSVEARRIADELAGGAVDRGHRQDAAHQRVEDRAALLLAILRTHGELDAVIG